MVLFGSASGVKRFALKRFRATEASLVEHVQDPRSRRGRRVPLSQMLRALWTGMVSGDPTLRAVEQRSAMLGLVDRRGRRVEKLSDTTLGDVLAALDPGDLLAPLVAQVRQMLRRKELRPDDLPCGVLVVDGKHLAALSHDANGAGLRQTKSSDGAPYWCVRALRAVLSSARGKPCIGQVPIWGREGEVTCLPDFVRWLHETFGRFGLFEIIDLDAGFLSREVFRFIDELSYGLIVGLKENQPNLFAEARRVLEPIASSTEPHAVTAWESFQGTMMRRKLYRTFELEDFLGWTHLRQVWLVVQETAQRPRHGARRPYGSQRPPADWRITHKHRYFATNLPRNRLTPRQILRVVRNHWAVENDCFHTLDVQWQEDRCAWCGRGNAVLVLGMLRMLAYNLVQGLRKRRLRCPRPQLGDTVPWPWQAVFRWLDELLLRPGPPQSSLEGVAPAYGLGG